MTALRFLAAHALYAMGCAVWWIESHITGHLDQTSLYRLYNALMCLSDDVQGDGPGPWSPAE